MCFGKICSCDVLSYMVTTCKEKNQTEKLSSVNLFKNKILLYSLLFLFSPLYFLRCAILKIKIDILAFVYLVGFLKCNFATFKNISQNF